MNTKKLTYDKNTVIDLNKYWVNILLVYTIFQKLKLKSNFISILIEKIFASKQIILFKLQLKLVHT